MSELLSADFLRRLERLRLLARRRFAGSAGSRRSRRRGASVEFADHRAYSPGDDIRRIDWNVFARAEELVLRLYVAEEDLTLTLLVDCSASMGQGGKLDIARRLAAALAYIALSGSERVSVLPWSVRGSAPNGAGPWRGRRGIARAFSALASLEAQGETDLRGAVEGLLARRPQPGLAVIISDFMDPRFVGPNADGTGPKSAIDMLVGSGFEPVLFQVLSHEEVEPAANEEAAFVDAETGERVELSLDRYVIDAYQRRLREFLASIEGYARSRGLHYARLVGEDGLEELLLDYLRAG